MTPPLTPEAQARLDIDRQLTAAGWTVQSRDRMDLFNHRAVAVREFALTGGFADYLLIVDKKAIGVVEAKAVGTTLSGVTHQAQNYAQGLPGHMKVWVPPNPPEGGEDIPPSGGLGGPNNISFKGAAHGDTLATLASNCPTAARSQIG